MSEYSENLDFIDLKAQQDRIREALEHRISNVLDHGKYIMGPEVRELEDRLVDFVGIDHALTCANGTDALSLVLMAWEVGGGDAVFVPSFTYVATAEAPAQLGATPIFVDVDEKTFNISIDSLKSGIERSISLGLRPAVVIAVDLFGQPVNVTPIENLASEHGFKILVDGAQSFGGSAFGKKVGGFGDATTTSFFPAKPLGCYGDGGAIFTSDGTLADEIDSIRLHGRGKTKYEHRIVGLNSRLDTIQAAILIEKMNIFREELERREEVASRYHRMLEGYAEVPIVESGMNSAWAQYTIKIDNRDAVQSELSEKGVPTVVYYPRALTQQEAYQHFPTSQGGTPVSEVLPERVLSLPMHPYLTHAQQKMISETLIQIVS